MVSPTGDIKDIQVVKGFDQACDNEAKRVIASMPKWIPGKQNGRNVSVYYTLPVLFRIE